MSFWSWLGYFFGPLPVRSRDPVTSPVDKRKPEFPLQTSPGSMSFRPPSMELSVHHPDPFIVLLAARCSLFGSSMPSSPMIPGNPRPYRIGPELIEPDDLVTHLRGNARWRSIWLAEWLVWAAHCQGILKDFSFTDKLASAPGYLAGYATMKRKQETPAGWNDFRAAWHSTWQEADAKYFHKLQPGGAQDPGFYAFARSWYYKGKRYDNLVNLKALVTLPDIRPILMKILPSEPWAWHYPDIPGMQIMATLPPILPMRRNLSPEVREIARSWIGEDETYLSEDNRDPFHDVPQDARMPAFFGMAIVSFVTMIAGSKFTFVKGISSFSGWGRFIGDFWDKKDAGWDWSSVGSWADSWFETFAAESGNETLAEIADWVGDIVEWWIDLHI